LGHVDLVTFPSRLEGFGNPVIEAEANHPPLFACHYPRLPIQGGRKAGASGKGPFAPCSFSWI